jgi:hypothetical protein
MTESTGSVRTLGELRDYVHHMLCRHENLVADQFQLQEVPLLRKGQTCGLQFVLHGPRQVRLGAVWAVDQNHVFYYDARGERFHKETLAHPIELPEAAA